MINPNNTNYAQSIYQTVVYLNQACIQHSAAADTDQAEKKSPSNRRFSPI